MKKLFQVVELTDREAGSGKGLHLGIEFKIGEQVTILPMTGDCRSYAAFAGEIDRFKKELEEHLERAKAIFEGRSSKDGLEINGDMAPEQIWTALSAIAGEDLFAGSFNALHEEKRREVAEYVLTSCNVFSGKAAVFSARYDSDSALLE
ncbi:MAG: hypothetical protein WAL98_18040 [Desulfatiglandaceae bacterium]|jgi:hypothetical protein